MDVYENCPEFEDENYLLRMVCMEDKKDLLKVYSDKAAVPFFNGDNCGGDGFLLTQSPTAQIQIYDIHKANNQSPVPSFVLLYSKNHHRHNYHH